MKWITAAKGIRYFEHATRRYGNHPDRYYSLFYKANGKVYTEALGWESENREPGKSMMQRAEEMMAQIRQNRRSGAGPVTKKERLELAAIQKAETRRNYLREKQQDITLDEFFEGHFKPFAARKLNPSSLAPELSHYRIWIKDILGSVPMREINLMSWDLLLAKLSKKNLSERTRRYICGTLCRILNFAKERGYEVAVPTMKQLGLPQHDNRRLRVIKPSELKDILGMLQELNINAYRITFFALHTGCRFIEAAHLKWSEVSSDKIIFRNTKNGTTREIPVPDAVRDMFAEMERVETAYVFTNDKGEIYREPPTSFKLVVDKLGLNDGCDRYNRISFHMLRHTAATYMGKNRDLRPIMDIFGWKSVVMAARYMHSNEQEKKHAMDSMASYLDTERSANVIPFNRSQAS